MDSQHVSLSAADIRQRTPPPLPPRRKYALAANVSFLLVLLLINVWIVVEWRHSTERDAKPYEWSGLSREAQANELLRKGTLADWLVAKPEIKTLACILFAARHTSVDDPGDFAHRSAVLIKVIDDTTADTMADGADVTKFKIMESLLMFQSLHDGSNGYRSQHQSSR